MVQDLLTGILRLPTSGPVNDTGFELLRNQSFYTFLRAVRTAGVNFIPVRRMRFQQHFKHLAVMDIHRGNSPIRDEPGIPVNRNVVIIAKVTHTVLLDPTASTSF